ncbi:MAG TPA: peptidyl-prolyl cis-trans isomerase [Tepidisphaeraceae bacterium]|nr:peptidyl-prolyl cis-trans isomerase [Tepidisphaeraceae bacterium]
MMHGTKILLAAVALSTLTGCSWFGGGSQGQDLNAGQRFSPAPSAPVRNTPTGIDQPGYIPPPESAPALVKDREQSSLPEPHSSGTSLTPITPAIPRTIREQVTIRPPSTHPAGDADEPLSNEVATPVAHPTTGRSLESYLTLGGVVAEVNEHPIYANEVLREIVVPLKTRARELDEQQFRDAALKMIHSQIERLASNERETAVAERNLDDKDKDMARLGAARWRQRQITENGGSLEMAKRKWAAEGYDFEDRVEQEYHAILAQVYYSKKVWPRVQVTADEIRRYYDQHINDEFTVRDEVRFRLIKIDPRRTGGREAALNKIKDLRTRALRGEDFSQMASTVNDSSFLMSQKGDVGWIQRGNYAVPEVEKAVWDLQPNQVSDIIDAGGAFYLAKVEERKLGRVMPFDEQAVQEKIQKNLRSDQFRQLRDKVLDALNKNAVVRQDADMINSAVDIAMQNYQRWHAGETD